MLPYRKRGNQNVDLEQFYMENYRIVFGYLFSLCGNRAWVEDDSLEDRYTYGFEESSGWVKTVF